jgi:O-antigen/teichoic acid export membrane protein
MIKKIQSLLKSGELKAQFAKGGLLLTGGAAVENISRFLRNIILTKIIAPEYFGLMATIMAIISTFLAFTEIGTRQAVIQNEKGSTKEFLNVAWLISSLRGFVLFIIAHFSAPFICDFFESPDLVFPLRIASMALIFNGIMSPNVHVLEKEMRYSKWVIIRQGSAVFGVVLSIVLSIYYQNIWPLVIGFTSEFIFLFVSSYILVPFRPNLKFEKTSTLALLTYARRMFGLPILTAVFNKIDIFTIGKILAMAELGLYSVAQAFAYAPIVIFGKIIRPLLLPLFSKMQNDYQSLRETMIKVAKYLALFSFPVLGYVIINASSILGLLYTAKYATVAIPFSIMIITVIVMLNSTILMQFYFAIGRPDLHRGFALVRVIVGIGLIYPAISYFGLVGAALTMLMGMSSSFIMQLLWANKLISMKPMSYLAAIMPGIWLSGIVIFPSMAIKYLAPDKDLIMLIVGAIFCGICFLIAVKIFMTDNFNRNIFESKQKNIITIKENT